MADWTGARERVGAGRGMRGAARVALLAVVPLVGCGEGGEPLEPDGARSYTAALTGVNGSGVSGTVTFLVDREEDVLMAGVDAAGLAPEMVHLQHVHAASQCPGPGNDANGDGWVDVVEGVPSYGLILVNLDADLNDPAGTDFPASTAAGTLDYDRQAVLHALVAGIDGPDPDPEDAFTTLDGQPLGLEARSYVLHGVPDSTGLPASVASIEGLPAHVTLPVACAELAPGG